MAWTIELSSAARRELKKIAPEDARRILRQLEQLAGLDDPYARGKALTGPYGGLWRYRVGSYRVICRIQNNRCTILVLKIGHRSSVYKR